MGKKKLYRRRRWVVAPRFQLQFALVLVLLQVNVGFVFHSVLQHRMRRLASEAGSLKAFLAADLWTSSLLPMVMAGLVTGLAVFLIGIRYSNQIVGPLPRLTQNLRMLARGEDPPRLDLRPGDVLEDLACEVNHLADVLRPPANSRGPRVRSFRTGEPRRAEEAPPAQ